MNIQDVAKHANVSVATVSRVLNKTTNVSDKTKQKVLDAIEELDYHPNLVGRNLRRRETKAVLIIMNSIVNSFFAKVIKGIEDQAALFGYNTMICTTGNDPEKIEKYLSLLHARLADGAILLGIGMDKTLGEMVKDASGFSPIIQCCEHLPSLGLPYVCTDDLQASFDATAYLLKKGRKRILHISCDNAFLSTANRLEGYRRALEAFQIPFDPKLVIKGNYGYRNALKIMAAFLKEGIPFDSILANNDRMAAGALHALSEEKIRVPEDVAVIGFDNTALCYMHTPGITSVAQSQYELGTCSFQMLYDKLTKGICEEHVILQHELIFRESTNI